jgi:DNA polymerase-3 subunit beta
MKVSCLQENLSKGLSIVGRAVSPRPTNPLLSHILLTTDGGRLRLSATNQEIGINCWIGARVEEEGALAVPARTLIDLVNSLHPDQVHMDGVVRTMTLNLRCGRSEANVKGMDAVEFPPVPLPEGEGGVKLDPEAFRTAIAQVAFAAATDEARPMLTGVLLRFEQGTMTMAAADGYRLSVRGIPLTEPVREPFSIIVPARAMTELGRISADQEEPILVVVTPDSNRVLFQLTDIVFSSQLIPGNFPDYTQIIPQDRTTTTVVGATELLKACRTAAIFAREGDDIVRFHIHPGADLTPGRLVVSSTSAETGDDVSELDASIGGEPVEIAFNVKYMIEVLAVIGAPQVSLGTTSSSSPGTLQPVGDDSFLHVIMPMHMAR